MTVALIAILWLCRLSQAHSAVGKQKSTGQNDQCLGSLVINQGVQLLRQADMIQSLEDKIQAMQMHQEWIKPPVKAVYPTDAFRAVLKKSEVAANAHVLFGLEFLTGQGEYNPHTGVYTITTPGVYLLGFQFFPIFKKDFLLDLYVNGVIRIRSRCAINDYTTSCDSSSVFHLQKGDTVWMQSDQGGPYHTVVHTFFFGALISPDP